MNIEPIKRVKTIRDAECWLWDIQQFGEVTSVFDVDSKVELTRIPVRILTCNECDEALYVRIGTSFASEPLCGHNNYCVEAEIDMVVHRDTVVYRRQV